MAKKYIFYTILAIIGICSGAAFAQKKDRVEIPPVISSALVNRDCQESKPGRAFSVPKPDYPTPVKNARVGGSVLIRAAVDEKGVVSTAEIVSGNRLLHDAAIKAARRAKFRAATCGNTAAVSSVVIRYDFIPFIAPDAYFAPAKIEEFADLKTDSPYYETVWGLINDYRLAFGYEDKKFYADAPLARGDFAQFLRLTLDLLSARAAAAGKLPREINLFYPLNPRSLTAAALLKNLKTDAPFYESFKALVSKYDIVLSDDKNEFQDSSPVANNELLDLWSKIFGAEAIPVNFARVENDRIVTRGEFALFLQESLQILTYKALP